MSTAENLGWARKYRPKYIGPGEYIGNELTVSNVRSRFDGTKPLPQVILLKGPRGCGKTSMGLLLSAEYHCTDKVDGHACGKCDMCQEVQRAIASGEDIYAIQVVDLASETGKTRIDDIINDAIVPAMYPYKYKILLMDECHMANDSVQNRLLKITEEPPEHLVFIFATTNPEKMLNTLLSRCQLILPVFKPTIEDLVARLRKIATAEKLRFSEDALKLLARKKDLVIREAITSLEQVAMQFDGLVNVANVMSSLGIMSTEMYLRYFRSAREGLYKTLSFFHKMRSDGIDPQQFVDGLVEFVMSSMKMYHGIALEDFPKDTIKAVKELFGDRMSDLQFEYMLNILEKAHIQFTGSLSTTSAEMLLVSMSLKLAKSEEYADGLRQKAHDIVAERNSASENYAHLTQERSEIRATSTSTAILGNLGEGSIDSIGIPTFDIKTTSLPKVLQDVTEEDIKNSVVQTGASLMDFLK